MLVQVPGWHLKQQQQHGCYAVSQGLSATGSEYAGAGSWPAPKTTTNMDVMLYPRVCLRPVLNMLVQVPSRHLKEQQQHGCYAVSRGQSAAGSECAGAGSWQAPKTTTTTWMMLCCFPGSVCSRF
jgi:hypothetical protein